MSAGELTCSKIPVDLFILNSHFFIISFFAACRRHSFIHMSSSSSSSSSSFPNHRQTYKKKPTALLDEHFILAPTCPNKFTTQMDFWWRRTKKYAGFARSSNAYCRDRIRSPNIAPAPLSSTVSVYLPSCSVSYTIILLHRLSDACVACGYDDGASSLNMCFSR